MFSIFRFYSFYLILESMSTNGRECCLSCYIWHLWRRVWLVHFSVAIYLLDNLISNSLKAIVVALVLAIVLAIVLTIFTIIVMVMDYGHCYGYGLLFLVLVFTILLFCYFLWNIFLKLLKLVFFIIFSELFCLWTMCPIMSALS